MHVCFREMIAQCEVKEENQNMGNFPGQKMREQPTAEGIQENNHEATDKRNCSKQY